MSRFHDAMMRRQKAEAEREERQERAPRRVKPVSIRPVPVPKPEAREVLIDQVLDPQPEISQEAPPIPEKAPEIRRDVPPVQVPTLTDSVSDVDAAYERIIQRLLAHRRAKRQNVVLVVSAVAGEGASTVARNLSLKLAKDQNDRIVLVDGNLRNPSQHLAFDVPNSEGMAEVLAGATSLTSTVHPSVASNLALITSGGPADSPPHLLSQPALHSLVAALQAEFDWVIMDGPPVTQYPDAASLVSAAGGALLVLRAEKTRWEVAEEAKRVLENSGVYILGAVLNRRRYHIPGFIYRRL